MTDTGEEGQTWSPRDVEVWNKAVHFIAGRLWEEEQKINHLLWDAPEKIGSPEYESLGSRLRGLQRARDITEESHFRVEATS